jgi:hypothetical protein
MPATSASSYPDPTGQLGDNPQDLQAYGTRASYSNPFLGTPDTILDEDAEFSHDGYIQPGPGF